MSKDLVVFAAGGYGREVISMVSRQGLFNILGFIDDSPDLRGKIISGFPVLGNTEWLASYNDEISVIIAVGNPHDRRLVVESLSSFSHIRFPSVLAETVIISDSVKYGKGCVFSNYVVMTVDIEIGDFTSVRALSSIGHDARIGDYVSMYTGVNVSGNVRIGNNTEVGAGVKINPFRTVGENVVLGAGSVVVKDIPPDCTAVGLPAVPIKFKA